MSARQDLSAQRLRRAACGALTALFLCGMAGSTVAPAYAQYQDRRDHEDQGRGHEVQDRDHERDRGRHEEHRPPPRVYGYGYDAPSYVRAPPPVVYATPELPPVINFGFSLDLR